MTSRLGKFLKKFFHDTLLKYSSYQTVSGYYIQCQGLSMGGRLSPVLADIFCHMMEKEIILKHFQNGHILHYNRYVDDCVLILQKGKENVVRADMNSFDVFLKFTCEKMDNEKLPF